jgi:RNA polymerase sigma-70 factor (ECF subfamily)
VRPARPPHAEPAAATDASGAESGREADASTGALVAAAREGDVTAFRRLVERYYERCLRFARNMGLGAEDAEEAVQDAFVRVHGALSRFAPGAAFEPWLFRILANRCRSTLARGRWWRRIQVDTSSRSGSGGGSDVDAIPAPAAPDPDLHEAISRALDTLPREQREAFLLRHVEGLEYHDMMAVTGAGLSALKMRVKRACDALRARLEELA